MTGNTFRPYIFMIGILLATVFGLVGFDAMRIRGLIVLTLIALGIATGLLEIPCAHIVPFAILASVFILASGNGVDISSLAYIVSGLATTIKRILGYMAVFTAFASITVTIRACVESLK